MRERIEGSILVVGLAVLANLVLAGGSRGDMPAKAKAAEAAKRLKGARPPFRSWPIKSQPSLCLP